jgi:multiple sugar transport system substrate-binding protein
VIRLRGMTWNHPRGIDPLVAHGRNYGPAHGIEIHWDARSLAEFEATPLDQLAAEYDLLIIDHPHVGMAAASGCLRPFSSVNDQSVGLSQESYRFDGRDWALAIDAAAQVAARRAGSLDHWPNSWDEVMHLARAGRVICALTPVHALMTFYTLCANSGHPCATAGDQLIDPQIGASLLSRLLEFSRCVPEFCFDFNPINVFERMVVADQFAYSPLVYGYVSYSRGGFRQARIDFGDIPGIEPGNHRGSTLGGTGVAISKLSKSPEQAEALARDLASAQVQRGVYFRSGGQPANRSAWTDEEINRDTSDFFHNTLDTLDGAYLRPRYAGYIEFQNSAGQIVADCLRGNLLIEKAVARLNDLFAASQPDA